jgi:DNA repair exonuclease SbcCD ATPase subunit
VRDAETDLAGARARLDSRATSLQGTEERIAQEARDLRERQTAIEAALDDRMRVTAEGESALQAWEQRLRIEAERLQDERSEHGVTSQDAFALMSELEAREATLSKLEAELLEAQAHLQAAAEDPQRGRDLDEREARLVAQEAELNRRLASAARDERDNDLVEQLRIELRKREDEVASREQFYAERRERLEQREERLARVENELTERSATLESLEDEVRLREARSVADIELREDKLEDLAAEIEEREQRLGERESDLAAYVARVQGQFNAA